MLLPRLTRAGLCWQGWHSSRTDAAWRLPAFAPGSQLGPGIQHPGLAGESLNSASLPVPQSLQIAAFLFTVCHVVIVVQDWFTDLSLYR